MVTVVAEDPAVAFPDSSMMSTVVEETATIPEHENKKEHFITIPLVISLDFYSLLSTLVSIVHQLFLPIFRTYCDWTLYRYHTSSVFFTFFSRTYSFSG